jgi:hypothetical protein
MRKIKDLVTVQLENALRAYPSNEKRYELLVAVRSIVKAVEANTEEVPQPTAGPVRDFIEGTHQNFMHGAMALALTFIQDGNDDLPLIISERAARTEASISPLAMQVIRRDTHLDCAVGAIVGRLWMEYYALLSSVQGSSLVSQSRQECSP